MPATARRPAFTLFELVVVLAVLVILGAVLVPSAVSVFGGNRVRAAADQVRGELAAARSWAIEDGVPYRVAVSADGTRLRRAPDDDFAQGTGADAADSTARIVEYDLEKVRAAVVRAVTNDRVPADTAGWVTVAVLLPDGTCRDEGDESPLVFVELREEGLAESAAPLRLAVQRVTGQVRVVTGGSS